MYVRPFRRSCLQRVGTITAAFVVSLGTMASVWAAGKGSQTGIFPLGEWHPVQTLSEEYIPFKGKDDIANRPPLLLELGDRFLDTGQLDKGFQVPIIGAVWQPRLWSYFVHRTALQTFDNHAPGTDRETELAVRMDWFFNLQLTGTDKILLGLRPFDNNQPRRFTRYTFEGLDNASGEDGGWTNELNTDVETLFFEGDLGSLLPALDPAGITLLDFGFTVGRQSITFQEGIIVNDTVDMLGFVRNNLVFPGTSNLRISGMWAWNRLDRNDSLRGSDSDADMYALYFFADAPVSTYNIDTILVNDKGSGDGFYLGLSSIQRIRELGGISTAFRLNSSFALEDEIGGNVVGDGTLLTAEISSLVPESSDIVFFNTYWGIDNYTQAGREGIVGGPLANTGILFASPNLSTHGAEINPFTDDTAGFAVGYQAFWDNHRRNLILELATRKDLKGGETDALGLGYQLQQAVGQNFQIQLDGWYTFQPGENDDSGARFEVLVVF